MLLANRTIGGFPLSIGTSLSFESLFDPRLPVYDPEREIPNKVSIGDYDELWVNIGTLYRNIVTSVDRPTYESIKVPEIKEALESEIHVIESLLETEGQNKAQLVMYYAEHPELDQYELNKVVQLRHPTTDYQKGYAYKQKLTLELFFKDKGNSKVCLLYTSPSPRDLSTSRMPSSA